MKKIVGFISVVVLALVLIASPGYAITGITGTATTDNTIVGAQVGSTIVKLGTDVAESLNTSTLKALGRFLTGQIGNVTLGSAVEKSATNASTSGSKSIGSGITQTVGDLASITLQGGKVAASVASDKVNSAVDFTIGSVDALAGSVTVGTTDSSTDSTVGVNSSTVSRDIEIGNVDVLAIGSLLDQLGVDPLALACEAVEGVGVTLGIDSITGTACDQFAAITAPVTGAIPVGLDAIGDTGTLLDDPLGPLGALLTPICALVPGACDTLTGLISDASDAVTTVQNNPGDTCAIVDAQLGDVTGALDGVLDELNVLDGVGGLLAGLLGGQITAVTDQLAALGSATATLSDVCNTLVGTVEDLLDTPLLSLDLINVAMDLAAKPNPAASATGAIGALKVGNLEVVGADDLMALGEQLNAAIDTVESALGGVLDATGLGLAAPSLDLLKVTQDKGKLSNGTYFAEAAMTVAHLGIPGARLTLPVELPLDVLSGLGSFSPLSVRVSALDVPAVSVDVGVFSGEATYKAAAGGSILPVTGVADSGLAFAGMITLIGAGLVRRVRNFF